MPGDLQWSLAQCWDYKNKPGFDELPGNKLCRVKSTKVLLIAHFKLTKYSPTSGFIKAIAAVGNTSSDQQKNKIYDGIDLNQQVGKYFSARGI